jgi:S-adenosylmethionine:tRNA ribosyltransferase-isomerase
MQLSDLDFQYPNDLVATEPARPTRVAFNRASQAPKELALQELLNEFKPGDLLVLNESKVVPARVFSKQEVEILFLTQNSQHEWQVLFPAREFKAGSKIDMPGDVTLTLTHKGLPQTVSTSKELNHEYFEQHGEVALPPYIQEARAERHNRTIDREWYQPQWARIPGSVAAPTASLHFSNKDIAWLVARGVNVKTLTLHVGAGTFLPVRTENLDEHQMHSEHVTIPQATLIAIQQTKSKGGRVWALGTTVTRALESWALGELTHNGEGDATGSTKLFIRPGFEFKIVDALLTNFHQPRSTLLSLVAAFSSLEHTKEVYQWAIEHKFRLFSYGDLSAWIR